MWYLILNKSVVVFLSLTFYSDYILKVEKSGKIILKIKFKTKIDMVYCEPHKSPLIRIDLQIPQLPNVITAHKLLLLAQAEEHACEASTCFWRHSTLACLV